MTSPRESIRHGALRCLSAAMFLAFCSLPVVGAFAQDAPAKQLDALKIEPPNYEAFFPDDVDADRHRR